MKKTAFFIFILISLNIFPQEQLNLEQCYNLLEKNYPLVKQFNYLNNQNKLDLEIIKTGKLPKIDFRAQATYQSDVVNVPFNSPAVNITEPNKDQYQATVSVNQLIFDGGFINATLAEKSVNLKTQQKQVEVNLYQLKEQLNQVYFSILLLQEKSNLLFAKQNQIKTTLQEVKSGIKFGVLLPNSDSVLEAELLKIEQQLMEVDINKTSLIKTLSLLIGIPILPNTHLENADISVDNTTNINRPELELFQLQKEKIDASEHLIHKKKAPKILGFASGGYGNPGLNMLNNSFQTYYIAGIKLNWNVFDWNSIKKQRESLLITKEIIDSEQAVFELNTAMKLTQQQAEINKISASIVTDQKIIGLRKNILETSRSQLKNGVITASAYVTELTHLYEAENNLSTHQIQLQFAKATYKTTKGL